MNNEKQYNNTGFVGVTDTDIEIQRMIKNLLKGKETRDKFCMYYNGIIESLSFKSLLPKDIILEDGINIDSINLDLFTTDGLYISKLLYDINDNYEIMPKEGVTLPPLPYYASIIEYRFHNAKLFNHYDREGIQIDNPVTLIKIPYDVTIISESPLFFDLYVNGLYVNQSDYEIIVNPIHGKVVKMINDISFSQNDSIIFSFISCLSKHFEIKKWEYKSVSDIKTCYRIDLVNTIWGSDRQLLRLFDENKLITEDKYHVSKGILSFMKEKDYSELGHVRNIVMRQYRLCSYSANGQVDKYNVEEFYISVNGAKSAPIPVVNYNENIDIFLFKSNGLRVNSAKFYYKDGTIQYYEHDIGMDKDDRLNFVITNEDDTLKEYTKFVKCLEDGQMSLGLPVNYKAHNMKILLFRSEGIYVSKYKYSIDEENQVLNFNRDMSIEAGDVFEFLIIEYLKENTSTAKGVRRTIIDEDNQTLIKIPYETYDPYTDTLVLLRSDGLVIGNDRYTIDNENKTITLLNGTPLYATMWVDFYLTRKLSRLYPLSYLNKIGGAE